jgi:hypothetical protein
MNCKGNCWDNAVAESLFSSFGYELEANRRDERSMTQALQGQAATSRGGAAHLRLMPRHLSAFRTSARSPGSSGVQHGEALSPMTSAVQHGGAPTPVPSVSGSPIRADQIAGMNCTITSYRHGHTRHVACVSG